jgi:hypothetical protein
MVRGVIYLVSLSFALSGWANQTYTTSTGAVFTQVQGSGFGLTWQDPSGAIWSLYQGVYANNPLKPDQLDPINQDGFVVASPATEACRRIGGALPTARDFERLAAYFEHDSYGLIVNQGGVDLQTLFPDMWNSDGSARNFWTTSIIPGHPNYTLEYQPYGGYCYNSGLTRTNLVGVICINH